MAHLRPRDGTEQAITAVELFFDLVYVFAVTQLSHLLLGDLELGGRRAHGVPAAGVWWAWIYTTWMVNWFDPGSTPVRLGPDRRDAREPADGRGAARGASGATALLFAGAYVALQVGRNVAGALLLPRGHPLRAVFERIVVWSVAAGALWIAGAFAGRRRAACCCGGRRWPSSSSRRWSATGRRAAACRRPPTTASTAATSPSAARAS